jgi:hypothetical protein
MTMLRAMAIALCAGLISWSTSSQSASFKYDYVAVVTNSTVGTPDGMDLTGGVTIPSVGQIVNGSVTVKGLRLADVSSTDLDADLYISSCSFAGYFCGEDAGQGYLTAYDPVSGLANFGTFSEFLGGDVGTFGVEYNFAGYGTSGASGSIGYEDLTYSDFIAIIEIEFDVTDLYVTAIPLPAGVFGLLTGLAAIGLVKRRKRSA